MFHCNNSGQIVSTKEGGARQPPAIHSRAMEGRSHLAAAADHNKVPDIRDASVAEPSRRGPADCGRGRGASPRRGAARPSPLSVIRSGPGSGGVSPSAAARAVAVLSRVAPRGPATAAGWRLSPWARLRGGGESTGSTGTAGWGAPPPAAGNSAAAAGTANWAQPAATPSQWGGGGRPNGAAPPAGAAQPPPSPAGAAKNGGVTTEPTTPQPGQDQQQAQQQAQQQPATGSDQPAAQQPAQDGQEQAAPAGAQSQNNGASGGAAAAATGSAGPAAAAPATPAASGAAAAGASAGGGADSADLERLKAMRAAITATEGWSSSQVNQESSWELPPSPEPKEHPGNIAAWKLAGVNNGLDVWHANLRNGGAPAARASEPQWGQHIPQTNIGGTWGEDDDSQGGNMWPGAPPGGPPGPPGSHWGGGGGGPGGPGGGPGGSWPGGQRQKDDWGGGGPGGGPSGHKPWEGRGGGGGGGGGGWPSGPPQHGGPGHWGAPDHSPPMARRQHGFDDWGNKRGGGGGGGWKEMGPVRPGMPGGGPPAHLLSRMPPGAPPDHKPGLDSWGRPARNGWGEAPPGAHPGGWGADDKWGGEPGHPGGWGGKPKTPTAPGGWGEPDLDWGKTRGGPPGGMHPSMKAAMADKYRGMPERPDDMEALLRAGGDDPSAGAGGDWRPGEPAPFEPHGFPPMAPPHLAAAGMPLQSNGGPAGTGGINPSVVQQLVRQQQAAQAPGRGGFPGQQQAQQPSPQQLRPLIHQIQMAVHAGHLNPAILQQPMGPHTLMLLNQLLGQIKQLDSLTRQQQMLASRGAQPGAPPLQSVQMEMMRVKSAIVQIQNQIGQQQQAMMMKQPPQPQPPLGAAGGGMMYKHGPGDAHGLPAGLAELSLRDAGGPPGPAPPPPMPQPPQSRLSQWKLPASDKLYRGGGGADEEFSRAPGSGKTAASPPLSMLGDSTWSSGRSAGEGGWPDTDKDGGWPGSSQQQQHQQQQQQQQQQHNSFADLVPEFEPGKPWKMRAVEDDPSLTPGSVRPPLPQMRAVEDDPSLTPGSVRSSLGLSGGGGSQDLLGKVSSAGGADSLSTWGFNPGNSGKHGLGGSAKWDAGGGGGGGGADWGVKSRGPPPGLNKGAGAPGGGGGGGGWGRGYDQPRSAFVPVQGGGGGGWGSSGSAWLLLRNLTAQIDGSTLKTLCMQHGPLHTFHMYLSQGVALVKYGSREEAAKAQGALNNCVLSNTTIMAESVTEETAAQALQQLGLPGSQQGGGQGGQSSAKPPASAAWSDMGGDSGGLGPATSLAWSSGAGGGGNGSLWGTGGLDEPGRGAYLPEGLL